MSVAYNGEKTAETIDLEVTANVPIVGGKLASIITDPTAADPRCGPNDESPSGGSSLGHSPPRVLLAGRSIIASTRREVRPITGLPNRI
jgi:hypothetical protein